LAMISRQRYLRTYSWR